MEQAGLIRRKPVAYDARLKKIILTDKAFELQAGMMAKKKELKHFCVVIYLRQKSNNSSQRFKN
jgi:DNA-binding MarR family transcriptional regulator